MSKRIRDHLRRNVYGLLALFFAISGTAVALDGQNTVFSDDITNGEVRSPDILNATVGAPDLATASVTSPEVKNETLVGGDIADDSLTGADIAESSLSPVPQATLGGLGRWSGNGSCDPEDLTFVACGAVGIDLPAASRVLVTATVQGQQDNSGLGTGANGECIVATSPGHVPNSTVNVLANDGQGGREHAALTAVTDPLGPGVNFFGVECNQINPPGDNNGINFSQVHVSAVALSGV